MHLLFSALLLLLASWLDAQDFKLNNKFTKYCYPEHSSKIALGDGTNIVVVDLSSGQMDTILPPNASIACSHSSKDYLVFKTERLYGIADWSGQIVIPPKYSKITHADKGGGFVARYGNQYTLIPEVNFKEIPLRFLDDTYSTSFRDRLILIHSLSKGAFLMNVDGDTLLDRLDKQYFSFTSLSPEILFFQEGTQYKDGGGLMNPEGEIILPFKKGNRLKTQGDYLRVSNPLTKEQDVFVNRKGELLTAYPTLIQSREWKDYTIYQNCDPENENKVTLKKGDQVIIACTEHWLSFLEDADLLSIKINKDSIFYTDLDGKMVFDGRQYAYCQYLGERFFLVSEDKQNFQIVDIQGKALFKIKDKFYPSRNNFMAISHNGAYFFMARLKGKYALFDASGVIVFEKLFDKTTDMHFQFTYQFNHLHYRSANGKSDILDLKGNTIAPFTKVQILRTLKAGYRPYAVVRKNLQAPKMLIDMRDLSVLAKDCSLITLLRHGFVLLRRTDGFYDLIRIPSD
ncbi:MAG: WG repeat-containing protein [Bacteroidota bacterium]